MLQYTWHVYDLLKSSDTSSSSNTRQALVMYFKSSSMLFWLLSGQLQTMAKG